MMVCEYEANNRKSIFNPNNNHYLCTYEKSDLNKSQLKGYFNPIYL